MKDEEALRLHDRASRGEDLTAEESLQLEAWYSAQDAAEARELGSENNPFSFFSRIQETLDGVAETARRIQQTMKENDSLRREIDRLRTELSQQSASSG